MTDPASLHTFLRVSAVQIDSKALAATLEENVRKFSVELGPEEIGSVLEAGDGIARVGGLPGVMAEEMVVFPGEIYGMAIIDDDIIEPWGKGLGYTG